jgi:type IV pilus assembly protein PilW
MCSDHLMTQMAARQQRGLSIVELMVGIVVALLVGMAATSGAISFAALQRQGVAAGGVAVNADTVMAALRDDVATAGLGFFGDSSYLCDRLNLSQGATVLRDGTPFSPVQVTRQPTGDQLDVFFGTSVESGAAVRLADASNGSTALLSSYLPVSAGQAVLITPAPATPPSAIPCLMRTVTAQSPSTDTTRQTLSFANTGLHNAAAFTNNPGFDAEGRVTEIGQLRWSRYRLVGTDLLLERPLDGASATIARNVVAFRIQYGITAAVPGSTALEQWVEPEAAFASLGASNLWRVRALRLGLIVRSPQREKPNAAGNCIATEQQPALFGRPPEGLGANWNCFRYRSTNVVVPLRNVVMGLR